jgi:hypothetical protein
MIDRTSTYDQLYVRSNIHYVKFEHSNSITIDRTNAPGSIRWSIDHIILSLSIRQLHYDWSDVRSNLHCVKSGRLNSIMINQINAIGLIGCLIDLSNTLGLIRYSINLMIPLWSIGVVLKINGTLDRTFIVSSLIDRTFISQ